MQFEADIGGFNYYVYQIINTGCIHLTYVVF